MSTNGTKTIKGRIQNKHNTEAGWYIAGTATSPFIPLNGELIIYDPDSINKEIRLKFGDGVTPVHLLPFFASEGKCIIDVTELPTENINEEAFYRLLTGTFVYNQFIQNDFTCYCVETLPGVGEPATTDMETLTAYYNMQDGMCYGYVDNALSSTLSAPVGWYDVSVLLPVVGQAYGGIVTSLDEATLKDTLYLSLEHVIYSYKDGWTAIKFIGKNGTGKNAEVFNHISNIASGDASHAEGWGTVASNSTAHAEGGYTVASGGSSHAEGRGTIASGHYTHAEGLNTEAEGYRSHAEGQGTIAKGGSQHVQGEYNIIDPNVGYLENRGKYAHIVGNGTQDTDRSNAHTLDWNGNAWFQGNVYVGGTSQDDTNAKKLITEAELDDKGYLTEHQSLEGYAKTSELFSKDYNDLTNKPTIPSIVGLATEKYVDDKISSLPGGGASSGRIITVDTLPTENIDTSALYVVIQNEVVSAKLFLGSQDMSLIGDFTVELVDELPSNPRVVTDAENSYTYVYWLTSDNSCSGYVDEEFASLTGVPSGWYPIDALLAAFGYPYGGIIESIDEITNEEAFYVLATKADKKNIYHYKDGAFIKLKSLPTTDDITATPNPCIFKTKELASLESISFDVNNDEITNIQIGFLDGQPCYVEVVEELPEVGEPMVDLTTMNIYGYYNRLDGSIYGYITEELAGLKEGNPVGWIVAIPPENTKIIYSLDELTDPNFMYGLGTKKPHLYFYDGEDWIEMSTGFSIAHNSKLKTMTFVES